MPFARPRDAGSAAGLAHRGAGRAWKQLFGGALDVGRVLYRSGTWPIMVVSADGLRRVDGLFLGESTINHP